MTARPVTAGRRRVALLARASETRTALADYLTNAGFEVHASDELAAPASCGALVWIGEPGEPGEPTASAVRSLMKRARTQRVVVVTSRPKALAELVASHGARLHVLPAPVFGWSLVDALRA
ncbi:MAG TPA: hypothetical protein VNO30_23465 [Kofleriaceae bacterium]|nr:hypothetical protein [Kofleriaceae bacterium]